MTMTKATLKYALLGGALTLGGGAMAEGDLATASMLANTCAGCHGYNGVSIGPSAPSIVGIDPLYFVEIMEDFKNDEAYSTIMGRIAKGYSSEEIERMAEYFHAQSFEPAKQAFDESLVSAGQKLHDKYCEKCHVDGGKVVPDEEEYHILAGQWTPYLKYSMEDFLAERREMTKKMASKVREMLEKDGKESLDALWAYYASQQ